MTKGVYTEQCGGGESAEIAPGRMKRLGQRRNEAQLRMHLAMKVKSDPAKNNIAGTWNVRSMNQGRLKVVKQEMAKVNINILGISELKWTGMSEFNSDDHYIYYCGQESLRRYRVALIVNKSLKCRTWIQSQK